MYAWVAATTRLSSFVVPRRTIESAAAKARTSGHTQRAFDRGLINFHATSTSISTVEFFETPGKTARVTADLLPGGQLRERICNESHLGTNRHAGHQRTQRTQHERGICYAGATMYGMAGDDVLVGSYGGDVLIGGSGHDTIYGRRGIDRCKAEVQRGLRAVVLNLSAYFNISAQIHAHREARLVCSSRIFLLRFSHPDMGLRLDGNETAHLISGWAVLSENAGGLSRPSQASGPCWSLRFGAHDGRAAVRHTLRWTKRTAPVFDAGASLWLVLAPSPTVIWLGFAHWLLGRGCFLSHRSSFTLGGSFGPCCRARRDSDAYPASLAMSVARMGGKHPRDSEPPRHSCCRGGSELRGQPCRSSASAWPDELRGQDACLTRGQLQRHGSRAPALGQKRHLQINRRHGREEAVRSPHVLHLCSVHRSPLQSAGSPQDVRKRPPTANGSDSHRAGQEAFAHTVTNCHLRGASSSSTTTSDWPVR